MKNKQKTPLQKARTIYKETQENRAHIKRLRKAGFSNSEIADALQLEEDSPLFQENDP